MKNQCDRCGNYYEGEGTVCPKCGWDNCDTLEPQQPDEQELKYNYGITEKEIK